MWKKHPNLKSLRIYKPFVCAIKIPCRNAIFRLLYLCMQASSSMYSASDMCGSPAIDFGYIQRPRPTAHSHTDWAPTWTLYPSYVVLLALPNYGIQK